jgi:hypothetical protein
LVGGFNPSEKYESQWEREIKDVPNHQPVFSGPMFILGIS